MELVEWIYSIDVCPMIVEDTFLGFECNFCQIPEHYNIIFNKNSASLCLFVSIIIRNIILPLITAPSFLYSYMKNDSRKYREQQLL